MIKNKNFMITMGVICIIPIIVGMILWGKLPENMATSFNWEGEPTVYRSRYFAVFVIPLMITAIHGLSAYSILKRDGYGNIRAFIYGWAIIICPVISLLAGLSLYAYGLGYDLTLNYISLGVVAGITLIYGIAFILKK